MDAHTVRMLGFILAENARVMGMAAENQARIAAGQTQAYTEDNFNAAAFQIEQLARGLVG